MDQACYAGFFDRLKTIKTYIKFNFFLNSKFYRWAGPTNYKLNWYGLTIERFEVKF